MTAHVGQKPVGLRQQAAVSVCCHRMRRFLCDTLDNMTFIYTNAVDAKRCECDRVMLANRERVRRNCIVASGFGDKQVDCPADGNRRKQRRSLCRYPVQEALLMALPPAIRRSCGIPDCRLDTPLPARLRPWISYALANIGRAYSTMPARYLAHESCGVPGHKDFASGMTEDLLPGAVRSASVRFPLLGDVGMECIAVISHMADERWSGKTLELRIRHI